MYKIAKTPAVNASGNVISLCLASSVTELEQGGSAIVDVRSDANGELVQIKCLHAF